MKVTVMIDTEDSFLHEYVSWIKKVIVNRGYDFCFITSKDSLVEGDILFLLGCSSILSPDELQLHTRNLVVHPSKLPDGRGSAALVWKILDGENKIWVTLFEADNGVDTGGFYYQDCIVFQGYELCDEIRGMQAKKTIELIARFLDEYPDVNLKEQRGKSSFYPRRTAKDSELDVDKSIADQFDLLRVVDNVRYPCFFYFRGHRYVLHVLRGD